jgi:hypothetical protein
MVDRGSDDADERGAECETTKKVFLCRDRFCLKLMSEAKLRVKISRILIFDEKLCFAL